MKNKTKSEKYVTTTMFKAAIKTLHTRLDRCVTKDEAKKFLTKDEAIKIFATKEDLRATTIRLATAIEKNSTDIAEIKQTMATKSDINILINRFDEFGKMFKFFDNRQAFNTGRLNEMDPILQNHETRIAALESKATQPAP